MINDLDETLRTLLVDKAGLVPAEVDISFEIPTREWSTPSSRPTVNLYLYDIRENTKLRETYWDEESRGNGVVTLKRLPLRIDLSYMITCWTGAMEDQHLLLWKVLETFFRNSPLPADVLQGKLKDLTHPIRTEVAQSDGILKNISDFWGALENQLRPAVNVLVTLDLDLSQIEIAKIVFARAVKVGPRASATSGAVNPHRLRNLNHGADAPPFQVAGTVRNDGGIPIPAAEVRLIASGEDGQPIQSGPTIRTDAGGRYFIPGIVRPRGETLDAERADAFATSYTLVVEAPGRPPENIRLTPKTEATSVTATIETIPQEVVLPLQKT